MKNSGRSKRVSSRIYGTQLEVQTKILELVEKAVIVTDIKGRVIYMNPFAEQLYGWKAQEAVGRNILEINVPETSQEQALEIMNALNAGKSWRGDFQVQRSDGTKFIADVTDTPICDESGNLYAIIGISEDIPEHKKIEQEIYKTKSQLELVMDYSPLPIILHDAQGNIMQWNPAAEKLLGWTAQEVIGKPPLMIPAEHQKQFHEALSQVFTGNTLMLDDVSVLRKDGSTLSCEISIGLQRGERAELCGMVAILNDITKRKKAEEDLCASENELRALFAAMTDVVLILDGDGRYLKVAPTKPTNLFRSLETMLGKTVYEVLQKEQADYILANIKQAIQTNLAVPGQYALQINGTETWFESSTTKLSENSVIWVTHDITERIKTEGKLILANKELLFQNEEKEKRAEELVIANKELLFQNEEKERRAEELVLANKELAFQNKEKEKRANELILANKELLFQNEEKEKRAAELAIANKEFAFQNEEKEKRAAELAIANKELAFQNEEKEKRAAELAIANKELAFQNEEKEKRAEELSMTQLETARRLQHIESLHTIDRAISSSRDLHLTLSIALEQIASQLNVDAVDVLLLNPHTQTLEYADGRGFRSKAIERSRLHLGEGIAGLVALEQRTISVHDLLIEKKRAARIDFLAGEEFDCYHGTPLIIKGQLKGVLEVFLRQHREVDSEWLRFLEILAGQVAIAVDSAMLFESLQRSNSELTLAYDETIEGWSHALDLRDKETEGHSQRVTEMTVRLARSLGLGEEELAYVRWGALLHDIGKMGIPDGILLKPEPLTDEEWVVMKKHPLFAYEMLSPIRYLKGALDIPYCHHEKWDGTGYPRGLKGEQIPLVARIFAVVDVWDALRSDRPYRKAWPEEKVLEHIRSEAGTHFDPKAVEMFLKMLNEDKKNT